VALRNNRCVLGGETGFAVHCITLATVAAARYYEAITYGGNSQVIQADSEKWPDIAGKTILPCNLSLPSFSFRINNNYTATVPGEYLNTKSLGYGYCYCGIQESAESSMPVLGAPFLMSQYAVFDLNGPRVGLAPQSTILSNNNA
jgi:hypothetical protein